MFLIKQKSKDALLTQEIVLTLFVNVFRSLMTLQAYVQL